MIQKQYCLIYIMIPLFNHKFTTPYHRFEKKLKKLD